MKVNMDQEIQNYVPCVCVCTRACVRVFVICMLRSLPTARSSLSIAHPRVRVQTDARTRTHAHLHNC